MWAKLDGDMDSLGAVVGGVALAAQSLHLFVDRRGFRPMLEVCRVTSATTDTYLDYLVADLEEFESNPWLQSTVSLLTPATDPTPDAPPWKLFEELPLGPPAPH